MNGQLYKVEEIIELTGDNASYYISQAKQGAIKIRGKIIRDTQGKLHPVLVKTFYQQTPANQTLASQIPSWGEVPSPIRKRKKKSGLDFVLHWFRQFFQ